MLKVNIVTPEVNSNSVAFFEQAAKKVSTTAKKALVQVSEKPKEKPLDLNYEDIYESRMMTGRNPYTGKVKYVSTFVLDRLM